MRRLLAVLFWSVLAAAFIGPGTVTTAASSGSRFGTSLLWALVFSTLACWALQEASARLTVVSGYSLGQALRRRYPGGWSGFAVVFLVCGAVLVGCAAYEAGNILGGVAGAQLALGGSPRVLTLVSTGLAALLLWFNGPKRVALLLSLAVAIMGLTFLLTAILVRPPLTELLRGGLWPTLPAGSALLALGLVGTTVVPYNLFLGSGLAGGQDLGELRFGIAAAVLGGGVISMGVMVVGGALDGECTFAALAAVLGDRLGSGARTLFAGGLFAAGLSSAVTAPLAAAVTARGLFAREDNPERWGDASWRYRAVWLTVLASGLFFGLSGLRPVSVILAAQALNGVLLPVVAIFLLVAVNDARLVGRAALNGAFSNAVLAVVVVVTVVLGVSGVARAGASALGWVAPSGGEVLVASAVLGVALALPVARELRRGRAGR